MILRFGLAVVCAGATLACAPAARSAAPQDGGSGTYVAAGTTIYFDLVNTGSAAWQSFYLVGPAGTTFVGGANGAEFSARCVAGQPDGESNEIECVSLPANAAPPRTHMSFVATVGAPVACGASFQLAVSSTSVPPYTRGPDVTPAAPCTVVSPKALAPPTLRGTPRVGDAVTATPPTWSAAPTRVSYSWQRCTGSACTAIARATHLRLLLTRNDAGHAVRLVATAVIGGVAVVSSSKRLVVR